MDSPQIICTSGEYIGRIQKLRKNLCSVCVYSLVISVPVFFFAMAHLIYVKANNVDCSKEPLMAAHHLISLVVMSLALYQAILTTIVLVFLSRSLRHPDCDYSVSVWYTSHITILTVYWVLFLIEFATSATVQRYDITTIVTIIVIAYQSAFIYFVVVAYRYMERNT